MMGLFSYVPQGTSVELICRMPALRLVLLTKLFFTTTLEVDVTICSKNLRAYILTLSENLQIICCHFG